MCNKKGYPQHDIVCSRVISKGKININFTIISLPLKNKNRYRGKKEQGKSN